jgi:hypothetical protein
LNFEVVVVAYEHDVCRQLVDAFERDLAACREVTVEQADDMPFFARLASSSARLLSPLL